MKEFNNEKFIKFDNSSNNNFDINNCDDNDIIFHFKELLNNYGAKNKDINNNFYLDIRRNLLKDFNNILNKFAPNYGSRANFGRAKLADYPTIYFIDIINRDQNNSVLLNYLFDCYEKKVHVLLKSNINKNRINENCDLVKDLFTKENIKYLQYNKKPFLESIVLKTYSIDNLDKNIVIEDFKNFIDIFEKVNYIYTDFPSSRVVNDFNNILDRYESEKEKPIKASFFASKLQNKFTKNVSDLVKNIINNPNEKYVVKSFFGINSWSDKPIISIVNENTFKSFQEGLHINYTFDTKNSKLYLSINPRSKNKNEYLILRDKLIEKLNNDFISYNNFIFGDNNIDEYSVILKEYNRSDINTSTLTDDLNFIFPIYSSLCDTYNITTYSEEYNELDDVFFVDDDVSRLDDSPNINDNSTIDIKGLPFKYFNVFKYSNNIDEFNILFNDDNIEKISEFDFKYDDYKEILDNILKSFNKSFNYILDKEDLKNNFGQLSTRDKMVVYAKSFANFEYKSIGKPFGYLKYNTIYVDDRLPKPYIITTIIHELAHYVLTEILEQIIMNILNTKRTPLIESFISLSLQEDLWYILDEFCAHTVEGRFTPYNYQEYGSYDYKINEVSNSISKQDMDFSLTIANTFARDIKSIFESFITENLREQIKDEYYNSNIKPNDIGITREIETTLNNEGLMIAIRKILYNSAEICRYKKDEIEYYANEFEQYYAEM